MKKSLLLAAAVLIAALIPAFAYAEPDDIAGGEYQGVDWRITAENELLLGHEGETQALSGEFEYTPWCGEAVAEKVSSVRFAGQVEAKDSIARLFADLPLVTSIDLAGFDTSNATDMSGVFNGCAELQTLDLSGFQTGNATDMTGMFAGCGKLETLNLTSFDTGNVTVMRDMFNGCRKLTGVDLTSFNTEKVTDVYGMFGSCGAIEVLDLSNFLLQSVQSDTSGILFLEHCPRKIISPKACGVSIDLSFAKNPDDLAPGESTALYLEGGAETWHINAGLIHSIAVYREREDALAAEPYTDEVDGNCDGVDWRIDQDDVLVLGKEGETQTFDPVEKREPDAVDQMGFVTAGYRYPWDPFKWSIQAVRFEGTVKGSGSMACMFANMHAARTIDLSGFDTSQVTSMREMFDYTIVEALDVSGFDTSRVTDMSGMFQYCWELQEIDVSGFDTENVTDMSRMFDQCPALKRVNAAGLGAGKVRDMSKMFRGCRELAELDLSSMRTDSLEKWSQMFDECGRLARLDISGFDTRRCKVETDIEYDDDDEPYTVELYTFRNCDALRQIALGKNTISKETLFKKNWVRYSDLNGKATGSGVFYSDLTTYTGKYPGWYKQVNRKRSPAQISRIVKRAGRRTLRRRAVTVKAIRVKNAKGGKVTYKRLSGSGRLKLLKGGKVKVRRYTKRGTYFMRVRVRVAGTAYYLPKSKIVRVKIRVR